MAMRRALSLGMRRRCVLMAASTSARSVFFNPGTFQAVVSVRDPVSCCFRSYAKKASRANKKAKVQQRDDDEDEDNEDVEEAEEEDIDFGEPKRSAKQHMEAAMEALATELGKLRTGRASAGMLDHVEVEVDGKKKPLTTVAAVSVSNPHTLTVAPFDSSMVKKVENAIRLSPLQLTPVPADLIITVPIPKLTKELIEPICKLASKAAEESKKSIRRGRQLGMDHLKKISSHLSKDELKRHEKEIEDLTKQFVKAADEALKKKEAEIMSAV